MQKLFLTLLTCLIFLSPSVVMGESLRDLVERDGLYYQKFTDVPYNGKVTGDKQGTLKNGKKAGVWVTYSSNGQLYSKGNFKNGKEEGTWVFYYDGQLSFKQNYKNGKLEGVKIAYKKWGQVTTNFKNDKKEGVRAGYYSNGQVEMKGNYKNGKREGPWVFYFSDGQLIWKGSYKNDKKEGARFQYYPDGTVNKMLTGIFKNDEKISD